MENCAYLRKNPGYAPDRMSKNTLKNSIFSKRLKMKQNTAKIEAES